MSDTRKLIQSIIDGNLVQAKEEAFELLYSQAETQLSEKKLEMASTLFGEGKKMDPVGKEDDDIDNDGDSDESDEYLKNRRKKESKAVKDDEDAEKIDEKKGGGGLGGGGFSPSPGLGGGGKGGGSKAPFSKKTSTGRGTSDVKPNQRQDMAGTGARSDSDRETYVTPVSQRAMANRSRTAPSRGKKKKGEEEDE